MGTKRNPKVYIAIDPGINGAVAALHEDGRCEVCSVPSFSVDGKRQFDPEGMATLIRSYGGGAKICIEAVHAMPGNGAVSMFFFGRGFGIWEGVLGALKRKYDLVPPQTWKKFYPELAPIKGDKRPRSQIKSAAKKNALALARRLFPSLEGSLKRDKDDGRGEALLMALFYAAREGVVIPTSTPRGHT